MGVTVESYKPWVDEEDADNVFFSSMHLCADNFYPVGPWRDCGFCGIVVFFSFSGVCGFVGLWVCWMCL